jgi:hypothetical protein
VTVRWSIVGHAECSNSLRAAIARATGVSMGTVRTIPTLLMQERIGGQKVTDMSDGLAACEERVDGIDCYRVSGHRRPRRGEAFVDSPAREAPGRVLWIERGSFLIQRLESASSFGKTRVRTVTEYRPRTFGSAPVRP